MELGAAVAGLTLFGAWIDRHWGTAPKGLLIGAALGMIGGLYNLIKSSLAMVRAGQAEAAEGAGETAPPDADRGPAESGDDTHASRG
jgi:F0F1-type ATP synthase assembly protein I